MIMKWCQCSFSCSRWVWLLTAAWRTGLGKRCRRDERKLWTERCWFPKQTTQEKEVTSKVQHVLFLWKLPRVTYRSTVRPDRRWGVVRTVIQLQEVVLAVSGVIDADLGEGDRHHAASGGHDVPFTVGAVGIGAWEVGACKWAMVSV